MTAMTAGIVVIGGGLAGAVSALKAREQGKDVVLVRKAWGATALGSGCFDIAGDILGMQGREWENGMDIGENIRRIRLRVPDHPYTSVGERVPGILKAGGEWFLGLLSEQGHDMKGSWGKNSVFPTVLGTMKPAAFCPMSVSGGNLLEMKGARALCLGISGLSDFNSGLLSRGLYEALKETPFAWESAESADIPLKGWIGPSTVPSIELTSQGTAVSLDNEDAAGAFIESVGKRAKGRAYSHILFPPVLGWSGWRKNIISLQKETGARCAEVLPLNPSVPGVRFQLAVDSLLGKGGIQVIHGTVSGYLQENGRLRSLTVRENGSERSLDAGAFVLASGRFIGGGITTQGRGAEEEIFGLPVITGGASMSSGVRVDPDIHPCDESGRVIFQNLFCAGSVIGGYDPAREMCGSGVALLTGVLAGKNAGMSAG